MIEGYLIDVISQINFFMFYSCLYNGNYYIVDNLV